MVNAPALNAVDCRFEPYSSHQCTCSSAEERRTTNPEVAGSIPVRCASLSALSSAGEQWIVYPEVRSSNLLERANCTCSSMARAPDFESGGWGFESSQVCQICASSRMVEVPDLDSGICGFKSCLAHQHPSSNGRKTDFHSVNSGFDSPRVHQIRRRQWGH